MIATEPTTDHLKNRQQNTSALLTIGSSLSVCPSFVLQSVKIIKPFWLPVLRKTTKPFCLPRTILCQVRNSFQAFLHTTCPYAPRAPPRHRTRISAQSAVRSPYVCGGPIVAYGTRVPTPATQVSSCHVIWTFPPSQYRRLHGSRYLDSLSRISVTRKVAGRHCGPWTSAL